MKTRTAFEESFKNFEFWLKRDVPKGLNFGSFSGQCTPRKTKILLKTKICAKISSLGLSSNINPKFILRIDRTIFDLGLHVF